MLIGYINLNFEIPGEDGLGCDTAENRVFLEALALVATRGGIRSKQVQLEQFVDRPGPIVSESAAGFLAGELFVGAGVDSEPSRESPRRKLS